MSDQLLTILKFCLLAVVYLFFFRVLRAVWAEINPPKPATVSAKPSGRQAPAKGTKPAKEAPKGRSTRVAAGPPAAQGAGRRAVKGELVIVDPPQQRGRAFPIGNEISIGRAPGCGVQIDEGFVSQLHARVFQREGNYVVEDLGSTNGTYVNTKRMTGPMTLQRGDRLQVGNTVLELE